MKNSTKDQIQGNLHEVKGKVKEKTGKLMNDPNLQADGEDETVAGKIQKKVGQIEKVLEKWCAWMYRAWRGGPGGPPLTGTYSS